MIEMEKLNVLRTIIGADVSDSLLLAYLALAKEKILARAFPFDKTAKEVPSRYEHLQVEIAAALFTKRGAEGQISHSENGVSVSYDSADAAESLLKAVVPFVGVI